MARKTILNDKQIALKLERMALEIAERNVDANKLVLAGIAPNGLMLVEKLLPEIARYFAGPIETAAIHLDKHHPREITVKPMPQVEGATVILVDDVANSGKTLTYALKPWLEHYPAKIQTLVLVDRTHKAFPIQPDYIGFSLATTFQEYIDVEIDQNTIVGAWAE